MNKKFVFLLGLLLSFSQANSQKLLKEFNDLLSKNDTVGQIKFLENWETSDTNDPDLYVAYFNYYYKKSMKEVIRMDKSPKGKDSKDAIQILDTLTNEPVGYMYSDIFYQPEIIEKGFQYINIGIKKFPARLDMRFGKIYLLGVINDFQTFTQEIIDVIVYSKLIDNKWLWKENKPLDDPKNFILGNIQNYQTQLYNTGNDSLLNNMSRIATTILKYYPDHVESLSNLAVVNLLQKNYEKALEALLMAEKIAPKDYIVLSNIAQTYKLKGDKDNALKYYELTLKYGDDKAKKYAKSQIQELREK